ncbi:bifunctional aspartate kinase/homoserine dehydrogenase I [Chryseobacterium indologenes]|uniref:bifunctional aspartate kinase/homoserine dehydrogenase I n=1 Tax=Chryseobacterium indologenes TaxID=253 RepID=UPI000BFB85F9|nr:bifunctional aspartate kinase/homoserine dehydrogenase I [Chryseobacterium indologenes]ATN06473.1 bifunctional aspartate kinase/homoserine dehydrogenase I [Chryseobacterium indologenes]AYY84766.1 bifunctional aspartate kinase/homoserine dehydrogenase I [Chryseobacterium indologenes]QIX81651.1 bifunctional aspartate kinase/homoserine dehydrogenase I [Chryseobacterium indologenes]UDQ55415.1 bifunctional aspartate kinase/homoserine dehydrogenase I [Chryseobacterium indologenes]
MKILKFGGTSVANAQNIILVENIIKKESSQNKIVVVVSALHGVTDNLIKAAEQAAVKDDSYAQTIKNIEEKHLQLVRELIPVLEQSSWLSFVKKHFNDLEDIYNGILVLGELTDRIKDKIASYGEFLSSNIIAARLHYQGSDCLWMNSAELIRTDSNFTNAKVNTEVTEKNIQRYMNEHQNQIIVGPGFIAQDENNNMTTLGRGGSDYTASIIAAAIHAEELQIWTDVSGMMTADPRMASNAKPISEIFYHEAMELSHFGAKVLYPPSIQPVMTKNINLKIKNTFVPDALGTLVSHSLNNSEYENKQLAVGISNMSHIALLTIEGSGMVGVPGISAKLFQGLNHGNINVILITQGSSEHSITVAIHEKDIYSAENAINTSFADDINLKRISPVKIETGLSIVALVGENMKSRSGVSAKMFGCLGNNGINIRTIAQGSSERNISVVISDKDTRKAVNILHEEFFESEIKQVHLYICGTGNVGSKLIQQIYNQNRYLQENLLINLRIAGLSNSRKMLFSDKGIQEVEYAGWIEQGEDASAKDFAEEIISRNLRNSVFIDITASSEIPKVYESLLKRSINIVACNKIAASSDFEEYKNLKDTARTHNCKFYFETNVGAGLPVIGTINDLIKSGDKITSIEAVLSGTLNFVFNNYDGSRTFSEVVAQAQKEGYTEPDPRLDLSGTDVARKILILARESGYPLQFEEIENIGFLPEACMEGSVENFYEKLTEYEDHFKNLWSDAQKEGKILKYVAEFKEGKAKVGLQHVSPESDLFHLYGKDNIVIFKTLRYSEQPLVVKGAGAGAEVTASGIFADIIRSI